MAALLKDLSYYCDKWDLSDPVLIDDTPRAKIYRVKRDGGAFVLKHFTEIGMRDEVDGPDIMRAFPDVFVGVHDSDAGAYLMEYLPGGDLIPVVGAGQDDDATRIMCGLLKKLHASKVPSSPSSLASMTPLEDYYEDLFAFGDDDPMVVKARPVARHLLDHQDTICFLHGDMHHGNVMQREGGAWRMIDPKGVIGDPVYDVANILKNPHRLMDSHALKTPARFLRQAGIIADEMDFALDKVIAYAFTHFCLSACWCHEDNEDPVPMLKMAEMVFSVMEARGSDYLKEAA